MIKRVRITAINAEGIRACLDLETDSEWLAFSTIHNDKMSTFRINDVRQVALADDRHVIEWRSAGEISPFGEEGQHD